MKPGQPAETRFAFVVYETRNTLFTNLGENMEKLKRLAVSIALVSVLAGAAFGGETNSPPCEPGQTGTPPCAAQSVNDDSADLGETLTPPAQSMVDVTDITEAVLWALSLF
jgi:hypothetical protein